MNCEKCGDRIFCKSTRSAKDGVRRRYACACGHKTSTLEIPVSFWNRLSKRAQTRIDQAKRMHERTQLRLNGMELLKNGKRPCEVMKLLSVPSSTVYYWAEKLQEATKKSATLESVWMR